MSHKQPAAKRARVEGECDAKLQRFIDETNVLYEAVHRAFGWSFEPYD
jgi:hypothetical protein